MIFGSCYVEANVRGQPFRTLFRVLLDRLRSTSLKSLTAIPLPLPSCCLVVYRSHSPSVAEYGVIDTKVLTWSDRRPVTTKRKLVCAHWVQADQPQCQVNDSSSSSSPSPKRISSAVNGLPAGRASARDHWIGFDQCLIMIVPIIA